MAAGAAIWGNCDWNSGNADVNVNNYNSYSNSVNRSNVANERVSTTSRGRAASGVGRPGQGNRSEWKHNPENRRGVQYRDQGTQQRYNRGSNPQAAQSREAFRGRAEQGRQDLGRGDAGRSFGGGRQGGARLRRSGAVSPAGGGRPASGAAGRPAPSRA
jgi:hypothetical protein